MSKEFFDGFASAESAGLSMLGEAIRDKKAAMADISADIRELEIQYNTLRDHLAKVREAAEKQFAIRDAPAKPQPGPDKYRGLQG